MALPTGINSQILRMHREDGLSAQQIADSLGYEVAAIELLLAPVSPKETEDVGNKFKEHEDLAVEVCAHIAANAENDAVRQRAAEFIIKVRKGVYDKRNTVPQVNIEQLNVIIQKAASRHSEMIRKVIDVPAQKVA